MRAISMCVSLQLRSLALAKRCAQDGAEGVDHIMKAISNPHTLFHSTSTFGAPDLDPGVLK